jgi:hypothetical protein
MATRCSETPHAKLAAEARGLQFSNYWFRSVNTASLRLAVQPRGAKARAGAPGNPADSSVSLAEGRRVLAGGAQAGVDHDRPDGVLQR